MKLAQAVVDFTFDPVQFLQFLRDGLLLFHEHGFGFGNVAVLEERGNFIERHVKHAEIADDIEGVELADAVVAVSGRRVDAFRFQQPDRFVMPQGTYAQMKEFCNVADLEKFGFIHKGLSSAVFRE